MNKKIWLSSPHMGGEEEIFIKEAFETNWIAPLGPNVNGFEKDLTEYIGVKEVAALSSGTGAIHLALNLLGVENGDEVFCQSMTFSASANPITYMGAKPVFIDSEYDTWNMSPLLLEDGIRDRIKHGIKPKVIIVVHLYGMPAKLNEIKLIADKYEIPLIEDAAEALGSKYCGELVGKFGEIGILSFNGNKIITTSGGGALVSNNAEYVRKARFLATQARDNAPHYQHTHIGYNYRMSNIVAGIGRGQMKVIEKRVSQRRANYFYYVEKLNEFPGIDFQPEPMDSISNRWLTCITVDPFKSNGITREDIRLALEKENIEARPLWKPMHMQPVFQNCLNFTNGTSEHLFNIGLCLPSGSNLEKTDLNRVIDIIHDLYGQKKTQKSFTFSN